ncbi:MAG TPA: GNAT family N-acetyltransferase [Caulobacteraceae bacterium]|jgi:ribosomal protein S18 acetylase RimI-like enzyme
MAAEHPLDRPIWSALTTRQAPLALGDARALRFAPEYEPFGAAADASPESYAALKALDAYDGGLVVVEAEPRLPPDARVEVQPAVVQMIWEAPAAPEEAGFAFVELGDPDAAEMFDLAHLTKPGPYAVHTHGLGGFIGVRQDGRLIAMAGERMKPDGFTEVSGVCTHPGHRGRGYAAGLMRTVIARILARGEVPFLHAYAANGGAIALYEALGFAFRREMKMLVLAK